MLFSCHFLALFDIWNCLHFWSTLTHFEYRQLKVWQLMTTMTTFKMSCLMMRLSLIALVMVCHWIANLASTNWKNSLWSLIHLLTQLLFETYSKSIGCSMPSNILPFFCYRWNQVCRVPRFCCVKHPIIALVPNESSNDWVGSDVSSDVSLLYLKRDRTKRCLSF